MQYTKAGQANTVTWDCIAKSSGDPITSGSVSFYLTATSGDNSGKWWTGSAWAGTETTCGAASHVADGHWSLSIVSGAWTYDVDYLLYGKESGDLHIAYSEEVVCNDSIVVSSSFPVSVDEAKAHMRVTHTDDDIYIGNLVEAVTKWAELFQQRTYVSTTLTQYFDCFPSVMLLDFPPLVSVTSIVYVDPAGANQTLAASVYTVDTSNEPGRVYLAYGQSWPSTRDIPKAITVTYVAGYGTSNSVPKDIKQAILMMIAHLYEHRVAVSEASMTTIPMGAAYLLWPRKVAGV